MPAMIQYDNRNMFAIKNSIEQTIASATTKYQQPHDLFTDNERFIAGLYASGQIDSDHYVKSTKSGIEVSFRVDGAYSVVNYLLPSGLRWTGVTPTKSSEVPVQQAVDEFFESFETDVREIARTMAFEGNDALTRERLTSNLSEYLYALQEEADVRHFKVVCDDTNNTSTTIDAGEIHIAIDVQLTGRWNYTYMRLPIVVHGGVEMQKDETTLACWGNATEQLEDPETAYERAMKGLI
jgi:hypothetical protein